MTTIPIGAPAPAPAIDQGAPGSPGNSGGGDVFLALVQGLLDAQPVLPPSAQAGIGEDTGPAVEDAVPGEGGEPPADAASVAGQVLPSPAPGPAPMLAGLAAALVPGLVAPPPAPRTGDSGSTAAPAVPAPGIGAVSGPAADVSSAQPTPATEVATSVVPPAPAGQQQPVRSDLGPTERRTADARPTEAGAPDQPAGTPAAPGGTSTPAASAAPAAPASPATPAAPTVPVAGVAAPTAPVTVGTAAPSTAVPVAHQVFPEIVRLTTSTEGPQRVTIRLNPEALGEVRVVLTERRGTLEVSLSGGSEARRALLEGTPELQRLLDTIGRGDSRIVVRDATGLPVTSPGSPAGTATGQTGPGTSWSGDLAGGAQAGAGRSGPDTAPDQDRRRAPESASTDAIASATNRSRTTETVTGARPGLDVTM